MATEDENKRRLISYIGFAAKSRKVTVGAELTLKAVRQTKYKKKSIAVLLAGDASERTKKQVTDKCSFYNVFLVSSGLGAEELASALGKKSFVSAAAVTDEDLAAAIIRLFSE